MCALKRKVTFIIESFKVPVRWGFGEKLMILLQKIPSSQPIFLINSRRRQIHFNLRNFWSNLKASLCVIKMGWAFKTA